MKSALWFFLLTQHKPTRNVQVMAWVNCTYLPKSSNFYPNLTSCLILGNCIWKLQDGHFSHPACRLQDSRERCDFFVITQSVGFSVLSFPPLAQGTWLGEFQKAVVEATKSFRITESWTWKRPKKPFIICIFPSWTSQIEVTDPAAYMTCGQSHLIYWWGWKLTPVGWMEPRRTEHSECTWSLRAHEIITKGFLVQC